MSSTADFPDDPAQAMAALGIETDESAAPSLDGLSSVRDKIAHDLQARQGPYRAASAMGRYWPFALAIALGALLVVLLQPSPGVGLDKMAASLVAALAGFVCLLAAAFSPSQPALGERLATVGIVVALVAIGIEGFIAASMPRGVMDIGHTCALTLVGTAFIPMGAVFLGVRRSGLPVRIRHAAAMVTSGIAIAGATVWLHCPADNLWHVMSGHMTIPALVAAGLAAAAFHVFARR